MSSPSSVMIRKRPFLGSIHPPSQACRPFLENRRRSYHVQDAKCHGRKTSWPFGLRAIIFLTTVPFRTSHDCKGGTGGRKNPELGAKRCLRCIKVKSFRRGKLVSRNRAMQLLQGVLQPEFFHRPRCRLYCTVRGFLARCGL